MDINQLLAILNRGLDPSLSQQQRIIDYKVICNEVIFCIYFLNSCYFLVIIKFYFKMKNKVKNENLIVNDDIKLFCFTLRLSELKFQMVSGYSFV